MLATNKRTLEQVEAEIAQREGVEKVIRAYEYSYEISWELPLIAGSQFKIKLTNYSRKRSSYGAVTEFYSMPSGKAFPGFGVSKHQRTRITGADTVKEGDVPVDDTACKALAYTSGGCYYDPSKSQYQYVVPVWPSFKKVFTLDVVYEDAREFYKLKSGSVVSDLGILFPRIDAEKEFEELAKLQEENNNK